MTCFAGLRPVTGTNRGDYETRRSTEDMVRAGHELLVARGWSVSPAKLSKLARRYSRDAAASGTPFETWIVNVLTCPSQVPRPLRDLHGIVDSTGETAVRNVLAGGRRE